jgi:hypothetical protein
VAPFDGGIDGLPCDVASLVSGKCAQCHRNPPTGGATITLLSRADFIATSTIDPSKTVAQRAVIRMSSSVSPMPPVGYPAATSAELSAFSNWVNANEPTGSCGAVDAGSPTDAGVGPFPTTCTSNAFWSQGDHGSSDMNPGLACKACHLTKSLFNDDQFMGTVFPSEHEKDLCDSRPPSGTVVEIVDSTGAVALTLTVSGTSGNFHSALLTAVSMPYTARIVANGATVSMTTPQTSGDCNSCHTEQGANGAPGRIAWPQ